MEMQTLKKVKSGVFQEMYVSEDEQIVFKRVPSGKWGYFKNGLILDTDRYCNDLAERNNFRIDYSKGV